MGLRQGHGTPTNWKDDADPAGLARYGPKVFYVQIPDSGPAGVLSAVADAQSLVALLSAHADPTPERLLFQWNLFEGGVSIGSVFRNEGVWDMSRSGRLLATDVHAGAVACG